VILDRIIFYIRVGYHGSRYHRRKLITVLIFIFFRKNPTNYTIDVIMSISVTRVLKYNNESPPN
jgi:hypothetical protein